MTDQSLFQEQNSNTPQATPEQQNPQSTDNLFADQLQGITNDEGKPKYASVEEAIKALKHSQEYIPQVKSERDSLEQQVRDLQEKLEAQQKLQDVLKEAQEQPNQSQAGLELDEGKIERLVQQKLEAMNASKQAEANFSTVIESLSSKFGAQANAEINKKAAELGTTTKDLEEMAKKNPKLVLNLFGAHAGSTKATLGGQRLPPVEQNQELQRPSKSLLQGAKSTEQRDFMKQIKASVYQKHGITE